MKKVWVSLYAVMVLFAFSNAGKITLIQNEDGYTGCYTETYYNFDHWDKRHFFQPWLGGPSFATNKSFAKNGRTTIADLADYCC